MRGASPDEPARSPTFPDAGPRQLDGHPRVSTLSASGQIVIRLWPLLVTFLLMVPTWSFPLSWDQSVYAYIGWGILNGHPPYRDAWAQNAPGNFFAYAAAIRLFGESAPAVAFLHLGEVLAGTGAVMLAARLLLGQRYAAPAGMLFGATAALCVGFWGRGHPEMLMAVAVTLTVVLVTVAHGSPKWAGLAWGAAGALAGVSLMLKPTGAIVAVLAVGGPLAFGRGRVARPQAASMAAFAVGLLGPPALTLLYLWSTGSLEFFIEQVLGYNLHYVSSGYTGSLWVSFIELDGKTVLLTGPAPVLAAIALIKVLRHQLDVPAVRLLLYWAGLTYLAVVLQGFHYDYHQYFSLPAFAVMGAVTVVQWRRFVPTRRRLLYPAAILTALYVGVEAAIFVPRLGTSAASLGATLGLVTQDAYLRRFEGPSNEPRLRRSVSGYLRQMTAPADTIFVVGEGSIYFAALRRAPTRLFQELPLWNTGDAQPLLTALLDDLAAAPPRYIVVHHGPEDFFVREQQAVLDTIQPFMAQRYVPDRSFERFVAYRRRDE
ncbi:MAG: hypothetical protein AAB289_12060 [Chloroflexota bacterium]